MNSIKVRLFEPAPLLHIGTLSIQILTDIPDDRSNGSKLLLLLLLGCIIRPTAKAGATNTAWEQEGKRTEEEGWETPMWRDGRSQLEEEHRARSEEEVDQTEGRTRHGGPTEEEPNR